MGKEDVLNTFNAIFLSHIKWIKFCHLQQHRWTKREGIMLCKVSQRKTNTVHCHLYVNLKYKQINEYNKTESDYREHASSY